jgi:hypothetical protein
VSVRFGYRQQCPQRLNGKAFWTTLAKTASVVPSVIARIVVDYIVGLDRVQGFTLNRQRREHQNRIPPAWRRTPPATLVQS